MLTLHASDHAILPSPDQKPRVVKDFSLTQTDYERFRAFLLEKIGLDFAEDKRQILARGLAEVLQTANCANLDELYVLLQGHSVTSQIWDQVVSVLTVGETYFFRNTSHFDCLTKHILPSIMADREHSSRRIRIWSAGCATGEEPYSVAMLLCDLIPNLDSWNISILATDLNREALYKAQAGVYGPWSFRGVEPRIQNTYFHLADKQYALDDRIRRMVNFDYLNLVGDQYPSLTNNTNAMDIILCRNVTIYFSPQTTTEVIQRFHHSLTDGGWLIPGPSEPNMVFYGDFEAKNYPGTVVYQKSAAVPAATKLAALHLPHTPAFTPPPAIMKPRTKQAAIRDVSHESSPYRFRREQMLQPAPTNPLPHRGRGCRRSEAGKGLVYLRPRRLSHGQPFAFLSNGISSGDPPAS